MTARSALRLAAIAAAATATLLLLLTVVGLFLPAQVSFARDRTVIAAAAAEIFPLFNSRAGQQRLWRQTVSDAGAVPPMEIVDLGGPDAGTGTRLGFYPDGRRLGTFVGLISTLVRGHGEIVPSDPNRSVVTAIDFGLVVARRTITLQAVGASATLVIWEETLTASNPLMRYSLFAVDPEGPRFARVLEAAAEIVAEQSSAGR